MHFRRQTVHVRKVSLRIITLAIVCGLRETRVEVETVRRLEGSLASLGCPWDTEKWAWLRTLKAELTDSVGELVKKEIRDGSKALASRTKRVQKPFTEKQTIRNKFFGVCWFTVHGERD